MLNGFPLQTGGSLVSSPAIFKTSSGNVGIAAGCDDHYLYAWQLPAPYVDSKMPWPMYLHDPLHSSFDAAPASGSPNSSEFFPTSRAYNWPNPVRSTDGYVTHIRYYVASNANVTVKIYDMAGGLVEQLNESASGGLDNEIAWNVAHIQSGIYFAHIDAQGSGGSGSTVIKIAVVK
jgi:hypothetical protein